MRPRVGTALVILALALGACQTANQDAIDADGLSAETRSDEAIPVGPGGSIEVETGDLFFVYRGANTQNEDLTIETAEGEIEVTVDNVGAAPHNFRVDEAIGEVKKVEASGGNTETGTLALFSGTYSFYCDIPGHRAAGMEGTLVVVPAAEADQLEGEDAGTESPADVEATEPAATETAQPTEPATEPTGTETAEPTPTATA
jgi:nitrite reductase (NO-forming)